VGKTKLNAMSPYDMTAVVRSRASANEEPLVLDVTVDTWKLEVEVDADT
jgi:hypothetical protein